MPKLIIFDFDGTLVDTFEAHIRAFQQVGTAMGIEVKPEDVRRTLGISAPEQFKLLLGRWDDAIFKEFASVYLAHNTESVSPFPGVVEMLKDLRAQGCKLAVLSNKPKIAGLPELRSCGLNQLLDAWFFIEDVGIPKPDPQGVRKVQGMFATDGSDSWMVGDYPVDISAGQKAGVASVAALWGSANPELTLAAKPDHVCKRPDEVVELAQRGATGA